VLQSSALEFSDQWKTACQSNTVCPTQTIVCDSIWDINADGGRGAWVYECTTIDVIIEGGDCLNAAGENVNPYTKGINGKWRLKHTYSFNDDRILASTSATPELREHGTYSSFVPFWDWDNVGGTRKLVPIRDHSINSTFSAKWRLNATMMDYGKDGDLTETKDILDRSATTIYGYNPTLKNIPVAIVSNAQQRQIGFDGFEDYKYMDDVTTCESSGHFNFNNSGIANLVDNTVAHTGQSSLKLTYGSTHAMSRVISECSNEIVVPNPNPDAYQLKPCDCEKQFSPKSGKYMVSAWVKQDIIEPIEVYSDAQIIVTGNGVLNSPLVFTPSGPIIDGWQRIEGLVEFDFGPYVGKPVCLMIALKHNGNTAPDIYFDDIRFHPFNSAMKTMVYNPLNLRLMAELDNQNYATFFEYDEEGTLVRIKKETEKGIVTVKESRSSIIKN
jgi:hypothetical protein